MTLNGEINIHGSTLTLQIHTHTHTSLCPSHLHQTLEVVISRGCLTSLIVDLVSDGPEGVREEGLAERRWSFRGINEVFVMWGGAGSSPHWLLSRHFPLAPDS